MKVTRCTVVRVGWFDYCADSGLNECKKMAGLIEGIEWQQGVRDRATGGGWMNE